MEQNKQTESSPWARILFIIGGTLLVGYLLRKLFKYLFDSDIKKTSSKKQRMRRVFISHSWNYDKAYRKLIRSFDYYGFEYYNHSIPEEKALDEVTTRSIEHGIRNKIRGCSKVLVLAGSYANNFWIKKEVKIASQLGKEIIAIKPWNGASIPSYLKNEADKIVGFNPKTIIEIIKN